ncbi:MAG: alpha-L-rhamnosidase C-terminal domain-containing protein [Capsulimonas sp.]|uniref:alpha-L-rhamnosidase-related protein n=1 Tax=Capsulimonas sp. TaxID=2494211 RepID=UPI00326579DA
MSERKSLVFTRREFIKASVAAPVSLSILGEAASHAASSPEHANIIEMRARPTAKPIAALTPTDRPWHAQWIGPLTPKTIDLHDAAWIWTDEAGIVAPQNAKPGKRFFRRQIDLPDHSTVTSAVAVFTADNHFKLIVNGTEIGRGDDWRQAVPIDIAGALYPGSNAIVVHAENDTDAAGLIGKIRIECKGQTPVEVVTDALWDGAETMGAAGWKAARVLGSNGIAPWSSIAVNNGSPPNTWTCYRKRFTLDEKPKTAIARIAVDSKYWLWVNGKLAVYEGELKRTANPRDTYFDRVDLAPYLQEGSNSIALLAWYWGKDGFSHQSSGEAALVFELEAERTRIISDATWKMLRHPAYGSTGDPHPNARMPDDNIHFDARQDIGDWTAANFNDSTWPAPAELGQPPAAPWNRLIERPIPQWRTGELTSYENAAELLGNRADAPSLGMPRISDGKPIIALLPRNLSISPYLKIKAAAGLTIDMRTDNYNGGSEYNYRSEYVTKDGVQEFESLAYLNGHWMIYSIPEGVEVLDLRYRETRYDTDFTGSFQSDDAFLDLLWIKARNTMNLNMRDAIQDADRERAQWWGDEVIVLGQILYSCDARAHALIRKGICNLVDWQKPDGVLFAPVPGGWWDFTPTRVVRANELPMQMLASIGVYGFWYYYLYTGDKATIAHAYPAVKRYLDLYKLGTDGLVKHRGGGWDWADWGENIDVPVLDNAWLYQALESAIYMARLTGHNGDVRRYQDMRTSIAGNYNRLLWTGTEYRSPGYKGETDERGHALAVLFGLAKPEQWPAIKAVLAREFHGSPYMEKYVLESLFRMNDADAAIARMKLRYRKMVESKYTTLWEGWGIGAEGFGGGSYNHGWAGGPLTLMMRYIAGVSPTSPGFTTYDVIPQLGALNHVNASFDSVAGRIEVGIVRDAGKFHLKLTSPKKTTATVSIPMDEQGLKRIQVQGKTMWRNGRAAERVKGVTVIGESEGRLRLQVAPGTWEFEAA